MNRILKTDALREAAIGTALAAAVGLFSLWLYLNGGGYVAEQGPSFHGSDILRVRENLLNPKSEIFTYQNLSTHPLFGLICIVAQFVQKMTGLTAFQIYALLAFLQGALHGLLLYICSRLWGASLVLALAIVAFYCSTAGFIYWTSITETHIWAGLSLLILIAMARWDPQQPEQKTSWGAVSFAVSFSIVVTNGMAWLISRLQLDRPSPREALRILFQQSTILRLATELLAGLGLILLAYAVTRSLLPGRVGPPLAFGHNVEFVRATLALPFNGFNAIGLLGPKLDFSTSGVTFANAAFGILACGSFFLVPPRLRFVPAFLLFALVFHSIFARFEGFLFSGVYTAAATLVFGFALSAWFKRGAAIALFALSVPLAIVNVKGFFHDVTLQAAGQGSIKPLPFKRKRHPDAVSASQQTSLVLPLNCAPRLQRSMMSG